MTNIVKTNNPNLRLAAMSVGVLSTLRVSLPLVPADATNVEIIVTAGTTHNAYAAAYDSTENVWNCDIAASQFPETGKQRYEVAYKLGGKQFWDGAGWITIDAATTIGLTPVPQPQPARYVVTTINGYGAPDADGAVRIPRLFISPTDPSTTTGYIEGDQYFKRTSGEQWVLCSVTGALTWVKCAGGGVVSVNGKVGIVVLSANDVGAYTKGEINTTVSRLDADITTALGAGTQALQDAAAAMSAANAAQSAASSAAADAATAYTEAANAYSNAALAWSAANGAESVANAARSEASEANENANRAAGKADTAQSTANEARSSASYANSRLDSLTTTDIAGLEDALAAKESVCVPSSSVTTITSGSIVDITQASGAVNVTFAAAVGNALRYCELIVRGVTADGGVTINLPSGMDALYAEGVASKAGINHYIFAEYLRGHWLVSRMTRTTTIS